MNPAGNERGVALLAVMGILLAVLPVAAAIGMQTHLDGLMQRNFRGGTEALYAAEAGLAHALSEIGPMAAFDDLLNGPDGFNGTSDDGLFPFRKHSPADFTLGPVAYEVSVVRGPAGSIRLHSHGRAHHDAWRDVEALIRPANTPFTPAALYVEAPDLDLDLGGHGIHVSGLPESNNRAAVAGLALSSAGAATRLKEETVHAGQLAGAGGTPSIATTSSLDLDSYVLALRSRLDVVLHPTAPATTAIAFGTESQPQLTVVDSSWTADTDVDGFGVLVVRGNFEINGNLRYGGLILVGGNLLLAESSNVRIDGALWLHTGNTAEIDLRGTGDIRYNPVALERTNAGIADALLHLPVVVGWREAF